MALDEIAKAMINERAEAYIADLIRENPQLADIKPDDLAIVWYSGVAFGAKVIREFGFTNE